MQEFLWVIFFWINLIIGRDNDEFLGANAEGLYRATRERESVCIHGNSRVHTCITFGGLPPGVPCYSPATCQLFPGPHITSSLSPATTFMWRESLELGAALLVTSTFDSTSMAGFTLPGACVLPSSNFSLRKCSYRLPSTYWGFSCYSFGPLFLWLYLQPWSTV